MGERARWSKRFYGGLHNGDSENIRDGRGVALTNAIGDDLFMPDSADQSKLESRVIRAAETALSDHH